MGGIGWRIFWRDGVEVRWRFIGEELGGGIRNVVFFGNEFCSSWGDEKESLFF